MWWDRKGASGSLLVKCWPMWLLFTRPAEEVLFVGYWNSNVAVYYVFAVCPSAPFQPSLAPRLLRFLSCCFCYISEIELSRSSSLSKSTSTNRAKAKSDFPSRSHVGWDNELMIISGWPTLYDWRRSWEILSGQKRCLTRGSVIVSASWIRGFFLWI